eukprot:GDKI01009153.1.p2 GENE.GDKI01009153.1~~GDKI01009153.1.p2  ORF type:complete len:121 (-),score=30.20 GDKI01009153.1:22-384(-)
MLRTKELCAILKREMGSEPSIKNIMLVTIEGGILAAAERGDAEQTAGAVLASVYTEYVAYSNHLNWMLMDCQGSRVALSAICSGALVLCVVGAPNAPPGILHSKMELLRNNLSEVLKTMY